VTEPERVDLLVEHGLVVTLDPRRRVLADGAVAVRDGRIVAVGKSRALGERFLAARRLDAGDHVVLPGLVDAHVHVNAEHLARSLFPDDAGPRWMTDWGFPLYAAVTPEEEHVATLLACVEMLRNGTTTFGEGGSIRDLPAVVAAVDAAGLRGVLGRWTWDLPAEPAALRQTTDEALAGTEAALARFDGAAGGRVRIAAACVFPATASPALLGGLRTLADRHRTTLTFHHGNVRAHVERYLAAHGRRPLVGYAEAGLLGPNVRAAHMVFVDDEEVGVLARVRASVVHCPQTCLRSGHGTTRVGRFPEMLAAGVTVALGSDGANSSDNQDLFKSMRLAAGLYKDARQDPTLVPAERALEMATLDGARALGLGDEVGSLEPGKRADLVLVGRRTPELTPLWDVAQALVYGTDGRHVETVIVDGRVLVERRRLLTVDEAALYRRAEALAPGLLARAGLTPRPRWPVE
jgi:5-methylthioadenosine/S-adenosylhomocysteine deaminase